MYTYNASICLWFLFGLGVCAGQENATHMEINHPLICDIETGSCETPNSDTALNKKEKSVKIIYFTDPICSSCWGIEPQLRKLKLEYGHEFDIEYRMGGLLPDWSYNSGGISKPSDVAQHWDEVSRHYDMPIDGSVWLEDPLASSYPPSIAFKAAQMQDEALAIRFLRRIREMVFLEKKNITRWEHLRQAAAETGLDTARLKSDYEGPARQLFQDDLALARKMGVRGFPTLFFTDAFDQRLIVYGFRPYGAFEQALLQLNPDAAKKAYGTAFNTVFDYFPTLTTLEFATLTGLPRAEAEAQLTRRHEQKELRRVHTRNGDLWVREAGR